MLELTRLQARDLRAQFRRSVLGIATRGSAPPLLFRATGAELQASCRHNGLTVTHVAAREPGPDATLQLPLDALADLSGRDATPVSLEAGGSTTVVARWTDRSVPQTRSYQVPAVVPTEAVPEPTDWSPAPARLLDALAEASAVACDESRRYALNTIALQGDTGSMAATDGHQLLLQHGFPWPWSGDRLIHRAPIFAASALRGVAPVRMAWTERGVWLRSGPWTVACAFVTGVRFPDVTRVLPDSSASTTRLQLDSNDARFLTPALERLPGGEDPHAPVTLDLNGHVAVRARADAASPPTELILERSRYDGSPMTVVINRAFLSRALRLGLHELTLTTAAAPLVAQDANRLYAWQPLDADAAIAAGRDLISISSAATPAPHNRRSPMNRSTPDRQAPRVPPPTASVDPAPTGLADLIAAAEALHTALADARTRAGRLTVALRRHRRRERLVAATLAQLRELKLPEVVS